MKNSNRRSSRNKYQTFENLNQKEVQQLCSAEIIFTQLTGLLFLREDIGANNNLKASRQMFIDSIKESLQLSQN